MHKVINFVSVVVPIRTHAVMDTIKDSFDYQLVPELPPESAQWRSYAAAMLDRSDPSLHLTDQDKQSILLIDNGDWKSNTITHYCIPSCPAGCRGSKVRSLQILKSCLALSITCVMEKPLLYRWKGFERANAYVMRGRKQHDLLRRALEKTWPIRFVMLETFCVTSFFWRCLFSISVQ